LPAARLFGGTQAQPCDDGGPAPGLALLERLERLGLSAGHFAVGAVELASPAKAVRSPSQDEIYGIEAIANEYIQNYRRFIAEYTLWVTWSAVG
jgi:hypothetical protein